MERLVDIRCYMTPEMKKAIKRYALENNTSVNRLLLKLITDALPIGNQQLTFETLLNDELQDVLSALSNSANLPPEERNRLKARKNEIKSILQKGV